jgi:hypothetical protein
LLRATSEVRCRSGSSATAPTTAIRSTPSLAAAYERRWKVERLSGSGASAGSAASGAAAGDEVGAGGAPGGDNGPLTDVPPDAAAAPEDLNSP